MCTLGAKLLRGKFYIFKNRDREYNVKTKVVQENGYRKKLLIIDQRGHCEGINDAGIGLIEASLRPATTSNYRSVSQITRSILDTDNLKDAISIIKRVKTSGNIIISDGNNAYIIEKTPCEYAITKLRKHGIITNFGVKLGSQNGPKLKSIREWAKFRYNRAKHLITGVKSIKGIVHLLADKHGWPNKSICSGKPWWIRTRCSYIYDLKNRKILFCNGRPDYASFQSYQLKI